MLYIKNLTKTYGEKKAVDDLSLHIAPGEIYGFIGHNGAGKTTTLKSVTGILQFDSGEITIGGRSIRQNPIGCKAQMAYIPDNPDLYEFMTGIKYLNFIADIFGIPSDVRLDRAGRRLPGRRCRAVRAELHHRRPHRGLRPGVAPAGGGVVCAPHHLPPDRGVTALWKCGKRPLRRWKADIHGPMEKPPAFPQPANIVYHSSASMTVYAHSHSAYCGEYPSYPVRS